MRTAVLTSLLLLTAFAHAQDPFAYKVYKVTGPPGSTEVHVTGMSRDGRVLGYARTGGFYKAFTGTHEGGYTFLDQFFWDTNSTCYNGTATGFVAGESYDQVGNRIAVYWRPDNTISQIGRPTGRDYAVTVDLNQAGQFLLLAGTFSGDDTKPYLWTASSGYVSRPPLPGCTFADPSALLPDGSIVGVSTVRHSANDLENKATFWFPDGTPTQLASPNGATDTLVANATSFNQVCGAATFSGLLKPMVWENGQPRLLQEIGGDGYCVNYGPNDDIVGVSSNSAVIWVGGQTLRILNGLVDPTTPGWILRYPRGISQNGRIVGEGVLNGVDTTPFIAIPVYGQDVAPESATVNLGWLQLGDFFSFTAVDNDVFRVCRFTVPNQQVAPVQVTVSGHTPYATLSSLVLQSVSRMNQPGLFTQKLELYDFTIGNYDAIDTRNDPITPTWTQRNLVGSGQVSRYRRSDGLIRARYSIRSVGPVSSSVWCSEHDMLRWQVRP